MSRRALLRAAALAALQASCGDPVADARVEALGGEAEGVPPGELHRPGQPCVLCHGDAGSAEPLMSVGGTVFAAPVGRAPMAGAVVELTDAEGAVVRRTTNCAGSFFVTREEWQPAFPLRAAIEYAAAAPGEPPGTRRIAMATAIGRDGSCAGCHLDPGTGADSRTQLSPGRVYCSTDPGLSLAATGCPAPAPDGSAP